MSNQQYADCKTCKYRGNCIHQSLKKDEKDLLNNGKVQRKNRKNEILFKQGYPATSCFLILEGGIKLSKDIFLDKPYFLSLRKSGSLIGFESLNDNSTYESTAQCITDTVCCIFPSGLIYNLIRKNKEMCSFLSHQYNDFISGLYTHSIALGTTNSYTRIAKSLLALMEVSKERIITVKINDLASISGTTRETTSRILSKMKANKLISTTNRQIHINDEQKLRDSLQKNVE